MLLPPFWGLGQRLRGSEVKAGWMVRAESVGVEGGVAAGLEVSSTRLGSGAHHGCEGTARKVQEAEETQEAHLADGTERSQTGSPGLSQDHLTSSYLLVLLSLSHLLPPG